MYNERRFAGWIKNSQTVQKCPVIIYVISLRHARLPIFLDLYES